MMQDIHGRDWICQRDESGSHTLFSYESGRLALKVGLTVGNTHSKLTTRTLTTVPRASWIEAKYCRMKNPHLGPVGQRFA